MKTILSVDNYYTKKNIGCFNLVNKLFIFQTTYKIKTVKSKNSY